MPAMSDNDKLLRALNRIARALERSNELREDSFDYMIENVEEEKAAIREAEIEMYEAQMLMAYDEELEGEF